MTVPGVRTSNPRQRAPFFDVHPQTGATIEVFYADRALETFGRGGAGWFWWSRRRGFSPDGPATGPLLLSLLPGWPALPYFLALALMFLGTYMVAVAAKSGADFQPA